MRVATPTDSAQPTEHSTPLETKVAINGSSLLRLFTLERRQVGVAGRLQHPHLNPKAHIAITGHLLSALYWSAQKW